MKDLSIVIENKIYTYDSSDTVFTVIYIAYQEKTFPCETWTDLTDIVLGIWTETLLRSRCAEYHKFQLPFMDGPFWMKVYKDGNMQLTIDCINARGINEITECTITCSYYDLLKALYDAIKRFNYILYSNTMHQGRFEPVYRQNIINMKEIKDVLNQ